MIYLYYNYENSCGHFIFDLFLETQNYFYFYFNITIISQLSDIKIERYLNVYLYLSPNVFLWRLTF